MGRCLSWLVVFPESEFFGVFSEFLSADAKAVFTDVAAGAPANRAFFDVSLVDVFWRVVFLPFGFLAWLVFELFEYLCVIACCHGYV